MHAVLKLFALALFFSQTGLAAQPDPTPTDASISLPAHANPGAVLKIGDIERDTYDFPLQMDQFEALKYCYAHGKGLPTARQWAEYAHELGARGIRETAHPGVQDVDPAVIAEVQAMQRDGYTAIWRSSNIGDFLNHRSLSVEFYYNSSGYRRPVHEDKYIPTPLPFPVPAGFPVPDPFPIPLPYHFMSSTQNPSYIYQHFAFVYRTGDIQGTSTTALQDRGAVRCLR